MSLLQEVTIHSRRPCEVLHVRPSIGMGFTLESFENEGREGREKGGQGATAIVHKG